MFNRIARGLSLSLLLFYLAGCCFPTRERVVLVCCDGNRFEGEIPAMGKPEMVPVPATPIPALPSPEDTQWLPSTPNQSVNPAVSRNLVTSKSPPVVCSRWSRVQDSANASPAGPAAIQTVRAPRAAQLQSLRLQFLPLPPLDAEAEFVLGPSGQAMTLAEIWQLAVQATPGIQEGLSAVESARQVASQVTRAAGSSLIQIQALSGSPEGLEQVLGNAEKVQKARTEAVMDLHRAQAAVRKRQTELAADVRGHFLEVLLIQEEVRTSHELARVAVNAYNEQVEHLRLGTLVSAEELGRLRDLAVQSRTHLAEVRKKHEATWQKLAGSIGMPEMPAIELSGRCREGNNNLWAAELKVDNEPPQPQPQPQLQVQERMPQPQPQLQVQERMPQPQPQLQVQERMPPVTSTTLEKLPILVEVRPASEEKAVLRQLPSEPVRLPPLPATIPTGKPLEKLPPLSRLPVIPTPAPLIRTAAVSVRPEPAPASAIPTELPVQMDNHLLDPPPDLPRHLGIRSSN